MQSFKTRPKQESVTTNVQTPNQKAQVVIVGAGLAGLAAAQRLHESGVKDVIVLDAQSRIGGRVHTISHSDYLLELGAQWLHGADENPLYKWLLEKNMLDDFEDASLGFKGLFCTNNGLKIDQALVKRVLDTLVDIKLSLSKNRYIDMIGANGFKNASQVFRHQLELKIQSDTMLMNEKTLVYAIFDWFLRYETIENCADSMDEVSIASYTDWTDWGDGTLLNFKNGYRSLLDWFCKQMPAKRWIYLNKEVMSIEMLKLGQNGIWSDDTNCGHDRPILVRYNDTQSTGIKISEKATMGCIECDHVIVTVSLGYLKKNHLRLFKPQLPDVKQKLIDSIGFGTVNKIILQFETPFWNGDHGIKLIWESEQQKEFPEWTRDIIAFDSVRKQPNLLIGWIGGKGAKLIEQHSDSEIAETCYRILQKFLPPNYNKVSRLVSCICSRWNSNPYVCGSYSFQSMRSFDQKVDKLTEPLYNSSSGANRLASSQTSRMPRVLFAGEATAGKLYSTTHGAIITGWREADRLSDHLMGNKGANIQQVNRVNNILLDSN